MARSWARPGVPPAQGAAPPAGRPAGARSFFCFVLFFRRHESVGPARSGASNFLEILEISQFFGNRFWPFSGLFRPPPGPGRSQDVAMIHGYVLASPRPRGRPKKGRKRPKTISKKIQNFTGNFQNPYFSFPRLWFPHLRFSELSRSTSHTGESAGPCPMGHACLDGPWISKGFTWFTAIVNSLTNPL